MPSETPSTRLSIVIPLFDSASTIERTITSLKHVARENRSCVQVILVDDGSSDHGLQLARLGMNAFPEFSTACIVKSNGGAASARNAALEVATGEWIFCLDSDDELRFDPVATLREHPDHTSIAFSVVYHRDGKVWRTVRPVHVTRDSWLDVFTAGCPFQPSSLLFRRDLVDQPFDERIAIVEDWFFWLSNPRLFQHVMVLSNLVSAIIHIHGRNISSRYETIGRNRSLVAERVLELHRDRLTRKQRNNLYVQQQIGRMQSGRWPSIRAFACLPCSPSLYLKAWVYFAARTLGLEATPYKKHTTGASGPAESGPSAHRAGSPS